VHQGVKLSKEKAIPFIKQKLGGVKHRIKNFLQDKWSRLKEKLGINKPGQAGKKGADKGAKGTTDIESNVPDDYARNIATNKPKMQTSEVSEDINNPVTVTTDFRKDLSGVAQGLVRQIEKQGFVRVDSIHPSDLVSIAKWFGKEIGVLQSPYHNGLRLVLGTKKGVLTKDIVPGEVFVVHTHPVFSSNKSHFGLDIPNAGKHTEAVVDWSGQIIYFNKTVVLNPTTPNGLVQPMPANFQAVFLDAQGRIVGYGKIEVLSDASGKTRVKVVE
jgi:hypothetical protein